MKKSFLGFALILGINLVYSRWNNAKLHITQGDEGNTIEFTCKEPDAEEFFVSWAKIDRNNATSSIGLSIDDTVIISDSRFSVRREKNENISSYILQIHNIKETDAGIYCCQVLVIYNHQIRVFEYRVFDKFELVVRRPPRVWGPGIDKSFTYNDVFHFPGNPVILGCYADGLPKPNISWRRENNLTFHSGGSIYKGNILNIYPFKKEDRGTYYCTADNGFGQVAELNVTVVMNIAPSVSVPNARLGQALHYNIDLVCQFEAFPTPYIGWLYNGMQLTDNQHYRKLINPNGFSYQDIALSHYRLINIEKHQYGEYTCIASNSLGTAKATITLYETTTPVCS